MKTLYISDLDGTFLNSKAELTPYSSKMLDYLIGKGVLFSVATARTYATVLNMFESVKLNTPFVLMNGVMIFDPSKKEIVKVHEIPSFAGKQLLSAFAEESIFPLTYFLDEDGVIDIYYQDLRNDAIKDYVNLRNATSLKRFHKLEGEVDFSNKRLIYMTGMDSFEILSPVHSRILSLSEVECTFCKDNYTDCYFLEAFSKHATKASGALEVKKLLGADRIVAFGDNLNDIPLFEIADEAYAVSNAAKQLKDIATGIIGSNDEDAVVKFIYNRY